MRPHVTLTTPDGRRHHLGHGDFIGRLWTAALSIDDARISEAHAMVSLRGDQLKLLGLRGRFALDDRPLSELILAAGQRIALARGYVIEVVDVVLPGAVLAISAPGLSRRVLCGVCSLVLQPKPMLEPGHRPGAIARFWSRGPSWSVQVGESAPRRLQAGQLLQVGELQVQVQAVELAKAARSATRAAESVQAPLRVVARFDSVHLFRPGEPTLAIGGLPARILSELVAFAGPTNWAVVAGEVWRSRPEANQPQLLRRRWDVTMSRLRAKLRQARIRPDLIRSDGSGNVELLLHPGDSVEDRT